VNRESFAKVFIKVADLVVKTGCGACNTAMSVSRPQK